VATIFAEVQRRSRYQSSSPLSRLSALSEQSLWTACGPLWIEECLHPVGWLGTDPCRFFDAVLCQPITNRGCFQVALVIWMLFRLSRRHSACSLKSSRSSTCATMFIRSSFGFRKLPATADSGSQYVLLSRSISREASSQPRGIGAALLKRRQTRRSDDFRHIIELEPEEPIT
jgi:hypothetical protein